MAIPLILTHGAAAAAAALLTYSAASTWHGAQLQALRAEHASQAAAAATAAAAAQAAITQKMQKARNEGLEREARLRRDMASSRDALYGLHSAAAEQRRSLPSATHSAAIGAADTNAELLADCARAATELAAAADGHAADALSLHQAWPAAGGNTE